MAGKAGEQGGLQQGDCCPDNLHSNAKSYSNSLYFTFKIKLIIIVSTSHLLWQLTELMCANMLRTMPSKQDINKF